MERLTGAIHDFMKRDASAGLVLMAAAALALIASNSPLASLYHGFLDTRVVLAIGELEIAKPALLWINDGLMAVFFFLVGLEIKREALEGSLSSFDKAALPAIAAVGGMAGPAAIYYLINASGDPEAIQGWAIPAATDIAFAVGILALIGARAPVTMKVLLLAVAVIDDLGAIIIIALFYTSKLSLGALGLALFFLAVAAVLGRLRVRSFAPYVILGALAWVCVLKSGVHATLAGVAIALCVPLDAKDGDSPLRRAEHGLHYWVSFLILPLFAFANAGVSLAGLVLKDLLSPVPLGIAAGLFFGKQIGVMGASFAAVKLRIASLPQGVNWTRLYGLALLCGVGFTMSLFIGGLAFDDPQRMNEVRLGVLMGSIISGIVGYSLLRVTTGAAPAAAKAVE